MKRSVMAALIGILPAVVGLAGAGPAAGNPVTVSGTAPCTGTGPSWGCAVDSYEVRCTQKAQYLSIRLTAHAGPYMTAVVTSPAGMAGSGQRAWVWVPDNLEETRVFHAPSAAGELMSALVVVMGGDPLQLPYELTASCYSYVANAQNKQPDRHVTNLDDDPNPEDPEDDPTPGPGTSKVHKATVITEKQDH